MGLSVRAKCMLQRLESFFFLLSFIGRTRLRLGIEVNSHNFERVYKKNAGRSVSKVDATMI